MVAGSGISLDILVADFKRGRKPEAIRDAYGTVSLADVDAVLAYYLRHRAEVEAYLAEQENAGAEVRGGLRTRSRRKVSGPGCSPGWTREGPLPR